MIPPRAAQHEDPWIRYKSKTKNANEAKFTTSAGSVSEKIQKFDLDGLMKPEFLVLPVGSYVVHSDDRVEGETLVVNEDSGQFQPKSFGDDGDKLTHSPDNVEMDLFVLGDDDSSADEEHAQECA
ncbi:hypothetical protein CDL15_Pgr000838 [Punica granatum]|uniref:Uncharacterized protein n=1 Tax=Punica granatum TaxID=22663 RepID=A0A218W433_PUNGR|nr:hypothetical protein CDL15_Pgr000838 [Punica granatum]